MRLKPHTGPRSARPASGGQGLLCGPVPAGSAAVAPGAGASPPAAPLGPVCPLEVWPPSGLHRGWNGRPGPAAGVHFLGGAAAGLAGPEAPWTPREARGRRRSPVSARGSAHLREGAGSQWAALTATADAEPAEQSASAGGASRPTRPSRAGGEGGPIDAHLGLGNRSGLQQLPSPEARTRTAS